MKGDQLAVDVVGAGPTGLTLSYLLARAGVAVSVFDAAPGPGRESSRATSVHAGALEALDRFDGLGEEIAAASVPARKSFVGAGNRRIGTIHWDRMPTRYPALHNLPQTDLEDILRRRLADQGVEVTWDRSIGAADQLDGDYVVGCDGAHSSIRRSIGVELVGATFEERFLLADVRLGGQVDESSTNVWVSTGGVLGVMPLPGGVFRLNGTLADDEVLSPDTLAELAQGRLGAAADRFNLAEVMWAAEYRTHSRIATAYRRDRVFLAGDAAHLNSPVGGQGMNVGIGDAIDLATRLAEVDRGGPADLLDEYEPRRRRVAERVIRATRRGTAMLTARHPFERVARNQVMRLAHRLPPVQRQLSTVAAFVAQDTRPARRGDAAATSDRRPARPS